MVLILNPNTKEATTTNLSEFQLFIGNRHLSIKDLSGDLIIENLPINEYVLFASSKSKGKFIDFFGKKYVGKIVPDEVKLFFAPKKIPLLGDIPFLGKILFTQSVFVYLAIFIVLLTGLYVYKTKFGLTLTSIGENPIPEIDQQLRKICLIC